MKKYYEDEYIIIYNSDCLTTLESMPEFDVMLTDPPYPNDKRFPCKWELINHFAELSFKVAKNDAWLVSDFSRVAIEEFLPRYAPWVYKDMLCAFVSNSMANCAFGIDRFTPSLVFSKGDPKVFQRRSNSTEVTREIFGDVKMGHPSPKYLRAYKYYIAMLLPQNGLLIDPFMGSGTSMLACKQLNRKAIGIEINEEYCKIAVKRLSQCVLPLFGTQETKVIENTSTNKKSMPLGSNKNV